MRPRRHWCLLGELRNCEIVGLSIGRNRVWLVDRAGDEWNVAFYADIDPRVLYKAEGKVLPCAMLRSIPSST